MTSSPTTEEKILGKSTVNIEFGHYWHGKEEQLEHVKDVFRWGFPQDRHITKKKGVKKIWGPGLGSMKFFGIFVKGGQ